LSREPAYVSPFVGRLDDSGENGMDLVKNICNMYEAGDHHVLVLAASIRNLEHLLCAFALGADLVALPAKILEDWAAKEFPMPGSDFSYQRNYSGRSSAYASLLLDTRSGFTMGEVRYCARAHTQSIQKFVKVHWST